MTTRTRQIASLILLAGTIASVAVAQRVKRTYAVTDATGAYLVEEMTPGDGANGGPRTPPEIRWMHDTGFSIPQTAALSPRADSAWVGEDLNNEAFERFAISGTGVPASSFSVLGADFTAVAAANSADRSAILYYQINHEVHLSVQDTAGEEWSHTFSEEFTSSDYDGVKISRDGSTVAAMVVNQAGAGSSTLYVFEGATGQVRSTWTYAGFAGPIDLDDTGALCLVTQGSSGRLIRTSDGMEIFSAPGSGGGARHRISGNGQTLVLGGFSFHVYTWNGTTYTRVINFSLSGVWFGWGAAVSRDGNTVAAMSHNYAQNYLNTATRIWDVPTHTLLGTYRTMGSGQFQDSISGAVLADDGSILAVSSWGAQDNNHPEVMVFDRSVNRIGGVDTRGSVFSLDMTGSGIFVLSGNKGVHANTFGNGGDVTLYQVRCLTGDLDCNCSVSLTDLTAFLAAFGACTGDTNYNAAADIVHDGCVNLTDLTNFLSHFGDTCSE